MTLYFDLTIVVKKETGSGFYIRQQDGKWDNFQPFDQYSTKVYIIKAFNNLIHVPF